MLCTTSIVAQLIVNNSGLPLSQNPVFSRKNVPLLRLTWLEFKFNPFSLAVKDNLSFLTGQ
jgi:hypothetical protein